MAKTSGSVWVEGNNIHYIDQFSREWYLTGIYVGPVTARAGCIWIDFDYILHFINQTGNGHYKTVGFSTKPAPSNASSGSLWVDSDNQLHWIAALIPPFYDNNVRGHLDVAAGIIHTDTHTDLAHSDVIHTDGAHTDVASHNDHNDTHNDVPHQDSHTDWHGDQHGDIAHQDQTSNKVVPCGPGWQTQGHADHSDGSSHQDLYICHNDSSHADDHNDGHNDIAHSDKSHTDTHSDHQDSDPHEDIAHIDIPHQDSTHTDTHGDAHTDTPHQDEPVYIGP